MVRRISSSRRTRLPTARDASTRHGRPDQNRSRWSRERGRRDGGSSGTRSLPRRRMLRLLGNPADRELRLSVASSFWSSYWPTPFLTPPWGFADRSPPGRPQLLTGVFIALNSTFRFLRRLQKVIPPILLIGGSIIVIKKFVPLYCLVWLVGISCTNKRRWS